MKKNHVWELTATRSDIEDRKKWIGPTSLKDGKAQNAYYENKYGIELTAHEFQQLRYASRRERRAYCFAERRAALRDAK